MNCKGILGWIFGHSFDELVYHSETPVTLELQGPCTNEAAIEFIKRKRIENSIAYCRHCGMKIEGNTETY